MDIKHTSFIELNMIKFGKKENKKDLSISEVENKKLPAYAMVYHRASSYGNELITIRDLFLNMTKQISFQKMI